MIKKLKVNTLAQNCAQLNSAWHLTKGFFENKKLFNCLDKLEPSNGSIHPIMEKVELNKFLFLDVYTLQIFPGILFFNTFVTLAIGIFIQIAFQNRPLI